MKKPEYAALTAYLYRKYTDLYLTGGREHYHVDQADLEQLMDCITEAVSRTAIFTGTMGRR